MLPFFYASTNFMYLHCARFSSDLIPFLILDTVILYNRHIISLLPDINSGKFGRPILSSLYINNSSFGFYNISFTILGVLSLDLDFMSIFIFCLGLYYMSVPLFINILSSLNVWSLNLLILILYILILSWKNLNHIRCSTNLYSLLIFHNIINLNSFLPILIRNIHLSLINSSILILLNFHSLLLFPNNFSINILFRSSFQNAYLIIFLLIIDIMPMNFWLSLS